MSASRSPSGSRAVEVAGQQQRVQDARQAVRACGGSQVRKPGLAHAFLGVDFLVSPCIELHVAKKQNNMLHLRGSRSRASRT